jgi:hypothetical protein
MQLIHVAGFINRVVYNGCKAYADQLKAGEPYTKLTDVVAISICDFELWPDAEQDQQKLARVPMLSRWYMTESISANDRFPENQSGTNRLLQVQYAFLELPKLPRRKPDTGALQWAWLFVHAPELTEVPADLPPGPYRAALELANEATFTRSELDAYRKVMDEIQQAREYGAAQRAEGEATGFAKGEAKGKADGVAEGKAAGIAEGKAAAILAVLSARGVPVSNEARARIEACTDVAMLDRWISRAATVSSIDEVFAPSA